jgi:hypothetical protein
MIYMMVIRLKRGMQWDRCQIMVSWRMGDPWNFFFLEVIGTTKVREKREIQYHRSQIRVSVGPLYSFFFNFCRVIL